MYPCGPAQHELADERVVERDEPETCQHHGKHLPQSRMLSQIEPKSEYVEDRLFLIHRLMGQSRPCHPARKPRPVVLR